MVRGDFGTHVREYYDEYGEREWHRFDRQPADRVNLEIHRRFLARLVRAGDRVLEAGAGPGRFTIQLAQLGATIAVADISPHQLQLNREKVAEAGCEAAVESRSLADVTDLSRFPDGSFDLATAYGGPLSYTFENAGQALDELLRVTRPGGVVAFSVMSRWGTLHHWLEDVLAGGLEGPRREGQRLAETGDLVGELARLPDMSLPHECHLFTWEEVEQLVSDRPCELIDASAANFLSIRATQALADVILEEWEALVFWEEVICRSRGVLACGTHILAALRKTAPAAPQGGGS